MAPSSKLVLLLLAMALTVSTVRGCGGNNCQTPPPSPPPPSCPPPPPPPSPPPPSTSGGSCPDLGVCLSLLSVPIVSLGVSPYEPCCQLLGELAGLDAAACLCDVVVLHGLLHVDVVALLNQCKIPCESNYTCRR
ncbi:hypothetical protein TRIUR3_32024 [Triticum urartu]|uniref:Hydrophobic seed protein domain-containing protein n=1 Tax=Triticum urartu TaxID=4572 RepID=M7Y4B8_TRIUA|nr:hydrophobic seed protein-like [Triticum urartu]EMS35745.1 hypothetical protein TRIUR3_32024 [Triticum urartu]